ncbi:transcriptional regulator [Streptomyces sp. NPDC001770]
MGRVVGEMLSTGVTDFPDDGPRLVSIPIVQLLPGDPPALEGEDKTRVIRLAALESPLPPILVDRKSMRVVDGIHRLMAASVRGLEVIVVEFLDGSSDETFLKAVGANPEHGLPLTQADRTAAAFRILTSHPSMSDRAIAKFTGLGARAVAELRRSSDSVPESDVRIGRDGKVRPLNGAQGRLRVAELIRENPEASLRQLARRAGVSPATALDVRRRLERGDDPVSGQVSPGSVGTGAGRALPEQDPAVIGPQSAAMLEKLMRDPSLRQSELGRRLLRMFKENVLGAKDMADIVASVPSHCAELIIQLSRHNARIWEDFAQELNGRPRVVKPD